MALTVVTPAAARDLTVVEALKDELGLSGTAEDFLIAEWIERATDAIRSYCNREFAREAYRETLAGHGGTILTLSRVPLVVPPAIVVTLDGQPVVDFTVEDAEAGLLHRKNGWEWTVLAGWHLGPSGPHPRGELPSYQAEYTAGYLLPGEDGRTLPRDVEKACIELVKYYRETKAGGAGSKTKTKTVGDASVTYQDEALLEEPDLPRNIATLLRPWRRSF